MWLNLNKFLCLALLLSIFIPLGSALTLNPYAHWHLNEVSGTAVADSSGNARNGNTQNMEDGDWVAGKLNNSLIFDGVNEYVDFGNIAGFERTDDFSLEAWVKFTDTNSLTILSKSENSGSQKRGWLLTANVGKINLYLMSDLGGNNFLHVMSNNAYNNGNWRHLIITYDGSSTANGVTIYIDGSIVAMTINTDSLTGTIQNSINCQIAGRNSSSNFFDGTLDEVVIYTKELNQTEVVFRYNSGDGTENMSDYTPSPPPANVTGLSPYKVAIANMVNNIVMILDKTTNKTINVSIPIAYGNINSVSRVYDGSDNKIVAVAGKTIFLIKEDGEIIKQVTAGTPLDIGGCRKTATNYYCGSYSGGKKSYLYKLNLNGALLQTVTTSQAGGWATTLGYPRFTPLDIDMDNEVIYVEGHYAADGTRNHKILTLDLNTLAVINISVAIIEDFFTLDYHSEIDRLELGSAVYYQIYDFTKHRTARHEVSRITAIYGYYPSMTSISISSYFSFNYTAGIVYEHSGTDLYQLNVNISTSKLASAYRYTEIRGLVPVGNVEIRASSGSTVCGSLEALPVSCVFQDNGNIYTIVANDDMTYNRTREVGITPESKVVQGVPISEVYPRWSNGYLKPYVSCWWNENEIEMGASGLHSLRTYKIFDVTTAKTGFEIGLYGVGYKWQDPFGWHWHTGFTPKNWLGIPQANDPAIMSGHYAAPMIMSFVPDAYLIDPSNINFSYAFTRAEMENWFYILNYTEDNKVHVALPYNQTHYIVNTIISNRTKENIQIKTNIMNWTELRAELIAFDSDMTQSIAELLTMTPMDTQTYQYFAETGELRVYGYVWADLKRKWDGGWQTGMPSHLQGYWDNNDGVHPYCANKDAGNYSYFVFRHDQEYINYDLDGSGNWQYTLDTMPLSTRIAFYLGLFNFEIYPTLTTYTLDEMFMVGRGNLPIGDYNYTCTSEDGQKLNGNFTAREKGTSYLILDTFNFSAIAQVGMKINVETRAGTTVDSGNCYFDGKDGYAHTSPIINGVCFAYDIPLNSYMNITVQHGNFRTTYIRHINDAWNSGAGTLDGLPEGDVPRTCLTFINYPFYEYTLILNPIMFERTVRTLCHGYGVPNAALWINNIPYGFTDEFGQLVIEIESLTSAITGGFKIAILSDYGNYTGYIANFNNDPTTITIPCDLDKLLPTNPKSYLDMGNTLELLLSPMFLIIVALGSVSMAIVWKTQNIDMGLMVFPLGIGVFTLMGVMPLFILVLCLIIVALIFAAKFHLM